VDDAHRFALERRAAIARARSDLARDFGDRYSLAMIEGLVTEAYDRLAVGSTIRGLVGPRAERDARRHLRALAELDRSGPDRPPGVLFLCVHNAGRSQMALGWLEHLAGDRVLGFSGGSAPAAEINPTAVAVMAEVGIDISGEYPKPWTEAVLRAVDVVVLMGCGDSCPVHPGKRYVEWTLDDPAGQDIATVRRIRDDVRNRVERLLGELRVSAPA
jgi:protein-tyrosine-phosphatase